MAHLRITLASKFVSLSKPLRRAYLPSSSSSSSSRSTERPNRRSRASEETSRYDVNESSGRSSSMLNEAAADNRKSKYSFLENFNTGSKETEKPKGSRSSPRVFNEASAADAGKSKFSFLEKLEDEEMEKSKHAGEVKDNSSRSSPGFINEAAAAAGTIKSKYSFLEKFKVGDEEMENPKHEEKKEKEEVQKEETGEIFKRMKEKGLVPNAVSMLDGLCKDGLFKEALHLFGEMREKGTFPEVVVYTAVVEGFCRGKKKDEAKRVFRKMKEKGVTPNAYSYGVLVRGLCVCREEEEEEAGRGDEALEVCLEMVERGHSPNVQTFVGLVRCLCGGEKGVEGARNGIRMLLQKGFFLDEKAVRDHLEKKGPFLPLVWEAIFGKNKKSMMMPEIR